MPLIQPTSEWLSCHSAMKVGISAGKLMVPAMARTSAVHSAATIVRSAAIRKGRLSAGAQASRRAAATKASI